MAKKAKERTTKSDLCQDESNEAFEKLKRWTYGLTDAINNKDVDDINRIVFILADTLVKSGLNKPFNYMRADNILQIKQKNFDVEITHI